VAESWLQHTLGRRAFAPDNQFTTLLILAVIIALIFGGIYLSQVASFATTNREIETLIEQRDRLERANEQLRAQIASLETVPRLLARAEGLGFRPASATDIEYLVVEGYNPNRELSVVPLDESDAEFIQQPQYDETFSGWVQAQFDALRQQFANFGRR
jgi:hypothetical protein